MSIYHFCRVPQLHNQYYMYSVLSVCLNTNPQTANKLPGKVRGVQLNPLYCCLHSREREWCFSNRNRGKYKVAEHGCTNDSRKQTGECCTTPEWPPEGTTKTDIYLHNRTWQPCWSALKTPFLMNQNQFYNNLLIWNLGFSVLVIVDDFNMFSLWMFT